MKKKSYIHPGMKRLQLDDDCMQTDSKHLKATVEGVTTFDIDESGGNAQTDGAKGHDFSLWDE